MMPNIIDIVVIFNISAATNARLSKLEKYLKHFNKFFHHKVWQYIPTTYIVQYMYIYIPRSYVYDSLDRHPKLSTTHEVWMYGTYILGGQGHLSYQCFCMLCILNYIELWSKIFCSIKVFGVDEFVRVCVGFFDSVNMLWKQFRYIIYAYLYTVTYRQFTKHKNEIDLVELIYKYFIQLIDSGRV